MKGALSLSVLRAMRERGLDVTVAYYASEVAGYTRDPGDDFARDDRLVSMVGLDTMPGIRRLESLIRERGIGMLVQIGAPGAYRQVPYLKERIPSLRTLDMLYNPVGHTVNHFLYERSYDGVIVESEAMRDFVRANSVKAAPAIYLVESGIDLGEFIPSKRQVAPPEGLVIGYVGRMSPEKNPLGFVEIAEKLHAAFPLLRFAMYGEGWMTCQVRARIAASSAAAAIAFAGYAAHARDALHAIDVLVVPSRLDGRPNAVMEANACGVPVLAAPVGGIPELIEDGRNGYLVTPEDRATFARVVSGWLEQPESFVEMRRLSRDTAERRFDRRRMLDEYAAVFAGASAAG